MTVVWCSISAHGFGHAAQLMPILNELGTVIDDMQVILRTEVPIDFFQRHLQVRWELQAAQQDVGCIQRGPLDCDVDATWDAYTKFHTHWERKVLEEARAIRLAKVDLAISNISHLAIAAAAQAQCPVIGIASLSWDRVLEPFMHDHSSDHHSILKVIRSGYALADHFIRLHPGIDMPAFLTMHDVGPSVPLMKPNVHDLRQILKVADYEILVLVAFGGVPLDSLPLTQMESMTGFHFVVGDVPSSPSYTRVHRLEDLLISFSEIFQQVDIIMSKPGYGTVVAAVSLEKALVYVRRGNFVDEQSLVDYTHRHGRGMELSRKDFESGNWEMTLRTVLTVPKSAEPPPSPGTEEVVRLLKSSLSPEEKRPSQPSLSQPERRSSDDS